MDPAMFHTLRAFRAGVYACLGARRDALFETLDAATTVGSVPSLPYLSVTALHRRRWGSLSAALAKGSLEVPALRTLVGQHPLDDGQPIYALDPSVWPRNDAETSPERGYYPALFTGAGWCPLGWERGRLARRAGVACAGEACWTWRGILQAPRALPGTGE